MNESDIQTMTAKTGERAVKGNVPAERINMRNAYSVLMLKMNPFRHLRQAYHTFIERMAARDALDRFRVEHPDRYFSLCSRIEAGETNFRYLDAFTVEALKSRCGYKSRE